MLLRVKKLFWILFILFDLCILAAVVGGVYYLESDEPRLELEKFLSAKLDREVHFHENFKLIFYPWLGVDTGPVTVSAPQGESYPHQLTVHDIDFKVRLLPLLSGELEVDTIIVDSPSLHVDRRKDGSLNLPLLNAADEAGAENDGSRYFDCFSVRGVSVLNATCAYNDRGSGNSFKVSGVNIRTGLLRKDTPLAFDLSAVLDAELFNIKAKTDLKGLIDFSVQEKRFSLSETSLALKLESDELLGAGETVEGIASLDFNLVEGRVDVKGLVLQGAGIRLSGAANCTDIYHDPDFRGRLKSTKFDPKKVFSRFTPIPIPEEYKDILNQASFAMDFHSTLEKTELSNMVLAVDKTVIKGDFSLKDYRSPWLEFDVRADSVIFDPYEKLYDLEKQINGNGTAASESKPQENPLRHMVIADLVRKIPCNGKLAVDHFSYDGIKLDDVALAVSPGPKIVDLSIGKGSYLDGDFILSADLAFDEKRESGVVYLNSRGKISPFSLARLPLDVKGLKFHAGKAAFNLAGLTSNGRTPGDLVRNLRLDSSLEGKGVVADLKFKGLPAELQKLRAELVGLALKFSPLGANVAQNLVGRKIDLQFSGSFLEPDGAFKGAFNGGLLCSRNDPANVEIKDAKFDFSIGGKGVPVIKKEVSLSVAGGGAVKSGKLMLDNFALKSGDINLHGNIYALRLGTETATAKGELKLPKTGCSGFFELFGVEKPETNDPDAFDTVELDSSFQLNGENLTLRVNKCSLDNAAAEATFQVSDFKNPFLNFVIKADNVDVDHFLPPSMQKLSKDSDESSSGKEGELDKVQKFKLPEWQFPDELIGAINATGKVECNYFRIFDFGASKVSADVDMQDAVIDIHNMKANFHEGNLAGKLDLGLKNGTVSLGTDIEVRGFQAGLFFVDYVGRDYVKGKTDASLKINGRSTANIDFVDTLTGGLAFKIVDGSYLFAATAEKDVKEQKAPSPTGFSIMKGAINGKDGRFQVADYLLKTNYLTATASGGFSFPDDSINLRVNADIIKLPNLYLKLVNAFLDAMTGVNVTVTGRLSNPKVEVKGLERWGDVLNDVLGLPEQSFMFFRKLIF
ncbi:AsmA family protein [Desulfovibrio sp. JC010]|uniref:AsmA family protein n=1 Tax=Desulfovibrio sp. JC010 TaxID=2593641 RepID=UPI0035A15AC5